MPRNPKKTKASKKKGGSLRGKRKTAPRPRQNINVKVNVGGEPQGVYKGPDRSYYAFNPVHDMGLPKQALSVPMNSGPNISSGAVSRPVQMSTQTDPEGIFENFLDSINPTVSIGSGILFTPGSPPDMTPTPPGSKSPGKTLEEMTRNELRDVARGMGIPPGSKSKADLLRLIQGSRQ